MQLRNGSNYSIVTFEQFKTISASIMEGTELSLKNIYKCFKHINSEFPEMYHKMDTADYNTGRNLYVVTAYQKSTELIASVLKDVYATEKQIWSEDTEDDGASSVPSAYKRQVVLLLHELNQTRMIMRRLIWGNIISNYEVKEAMATLYEYEFDESYFETKLYRCLMHMYDIDSNNATAEYGWFEKYKKNEDNNITETYSNLEIYDYYYSGPGFVERDPYIMSYNKCFEKPIKSLNSLYWM